MNLIISKYLKLTQPIGEFYCCVMKAKDLFDISYSDVRTLEKEQSTEDGFDTYLGIQRLLSPTRVNKIKEYIKSVDATFPNSIIVAIPEKFVKLSESDLILEFTDEQKGSVAKILDGQHRLAGFENTDGTYTSRDKKELDFEILVTIFVEADLHTQAQVFTMVNQSQTKVNKSLVYDLESLALAKSPYKTAHQIAVLLNSREDSPFYHRIKRLGVKTEGIQGELLTQAAFVDNLIELMTKKASLDRDILLGKKKGFLGLKSKVLPDNEDKDYKRLIFRKSFLDENDAAIAANVLNYYSAVCERWPNVWDKENKDSVLNKTIGLISTMRLLRDIFNKMVLTEGFKYGDVIGKQDYLTHLNKIDITDEYFLKIDAVSKSSGVIYNKMAEYI